MTKRTTYRQVLNLSSNICPFSSDMVTLRFLFKEACYSQIKSDDINKVTTIPCLTQGNGLKQGQIKPRSVVWMKNEGLCTGLITAI